MKLHKPTIASCVLTILLVAELRGIGVTQPRRLRRRHVEPA